eukprot:scaffold60003_cov57-Phaeocystis_antarctica.AAC.1
MACEPEGRREAVICAAGTSWGTLRRLPSSVCVLDAIWQAFGSRRGLPSKWLWQPESLVNGVLDTRRRLTMHP